MFPGPILALSAGFEDTLADIISWVVFIIVPILFIALFWMVHILPEKYAHKRNHPQADAIHVMCLVSLFFGGLLWPVAMIWAFTKPVRLQVEARPPPESSAVVCRRARDRSGPSGSGTRAMLELLLIIYGLVVWLVFFKLKLLPWNTTWQVIVISTPIFGAIALILTINVFQPISKDARVLRQVVQIIPRVTGRVIEVPIEGNVLVKKGDVLFRIDPSPFEFEVATSPGRAGRCAGRGARARRAAAIGDGPGRASRRVAWRRPRVK